MAQLIGKLLIDLVESLSNVGVVLILSHEERDVLVINLRIAVQLQREFHITTELSPYDKTARNFLTFLHLAPTMILLA